MEKKLKELCNSINDEQFETLVLLYFNYLGSTVISAETCADVKRYILWNALEYKCELLAIAPNVGVVDEDYLEALFPGYDGYTIAENSDDEKVTLLNWLYTEDTDMLPRNLKELKDRVDSLNEVFDTPIGMGDDDVD